MNRYSIKANPSAARFRCAINKLPPKVRNLVVDVLEARMRATIDKLWDVGMSVRWAQNTGPSFQDGANELKHAGLRARVVNP